MEQEEIPSSFRSAARTSVDLRSGDLEAARSFPPSGGSTRTKKDRDPLFLLPIQTEESFLTGDGRGTRNGECRRNREIGREGERKFRGLLSPRNRFRPVEARAIQVRFFQASVADFFSDYQ
ncbi:hypothetical protein KSP39_PZI018374 [Platanthera zijinensis]|uniref:Uncharacterized protein n=1 Tax=Platanthera zijinensis TaxID=2320716 RepID=A0AAP0B2P0_9ASPA